MINERYNQGEMKGSADDLGTRNLDRTARHHNRHGVEDGIYGYSLDSKAKGRDGGRIRDIIEEEDCYFRDMENIYDPPEGTLLNTEHFISSRDALEHLRTSEFIRHLANGQELLSEKKTFLCKAGFVFSEWTEQVGGKRFHYTPHYVIIFTEWGRVGAFLDDDSVYLEVYSSDPQAIKTFLSSQLTKGLTEEREIVKWAYVGPNGMDVHRVPIDRITPIRSAYPWLERGADTYIDDFFNSSASILILIGPPGTGKTSFLKTLISRTRTIAYVSYDERVLQNDELFVHFMADKGSDLLIFEDADTYLGSRHGTGNTMMHRFLNVSDGIISPLKGKKLVFTTNLPSVKDIDPALMRPGRCFDVLHFRALKAEEGQAVVNEVFGEGSRKITQTSTLAEILNKEQAERIRAEKGMGFLG